MEALPPELSLPSNDTAGRACRSVGSQAGAEEPDANQMNPKPQNSNLTIRLREWQRKKHPVLLPN